MSGDFLSRWSRRKNAVRRGEEAVEAPPKTAPEPPPAVAVAAAPASGEAVPAPQPLPPLESLTNESDFSPFMNAEVDPALRRQALKTLFQNPRFNVQDGLDVYIGDYSQPDPLPEGWLEQLNQMARLGAYEEPLPNGAEKAESEPSGDPDATPNDAEPGGETQANEALGEAEQGDGAPPPMDKPLPPPVGESGTLVRPPATPPGCNIP